MDLSSSKGTVKRSFQVILPSAMANSFVCDGGNSKAKVTELKCRPGLEQGGFVYITPLKFLALEAGGVKNFLMRLVFFGLVKRLCPHPQVPSRLILCYSKSKIELN